MISGKTLKHFLALLNNQFVLSRVKMSKNIWIKTLVPRPWIKKILREYIFGKCFLALLTAKRS
jgi:hypothetical protein